MAVLFLPRISNESQHSPIEYRRSPTRAFQVFVRELMGRECEVAIPGDMTAVENNRQCREFIRNNGSQTFMAHSTDKSSAERMFEEGFTMLGMVNPRRSIDGSSPTVPALQRSFVLLAGPSNKDQARFNAHALAYRYQDPLKNNVKVVFAFPVPHDGGQNHVGLAEFQKTAFGRADGEMIVPLASDHPLGEFNIPGRFAVGYFDLEQGSFVYNPHFNNVVGQS